MDIDTSGWEPFDANDPRDAMCERERHAFTAYTLKRLRKSPKTGSDQEAIWVGGVMALAQMVYAIHGNNPPESAREGLHQAFDYAWLQCATMSADKASLS